MTVDIYVRERKGDREIRVPWLPEEITYKSGGIISASYDIMNRGEVAVPTGSGLAQVSWKSEFPGAGRTDMSLMRGSWQEPKAYHTILEDWRKNQTPLTLLVTGYPINLDVFLSNYTATPSGGFGDLEYDVEFTEDRDLTITFTEAEDDGSGDGTERPTEPTTSYTIKQGDCMWNIAQQYLGDGTRWPEIYEANKEIIDAEAKKYGNSNSMNGTLIYAGVTLKIPQA